MRTLCECMCIIDDNVENCPKCNACIECCECIGDVIEERIHSITFEVKVKIHDFNHKNNVWTTYNSIEDCIRGWNFGNERYGAHSWDTEFCHIHIAPGLGEDRYHLLYI